ncbi:MAG TPA: nickel pincer cofactor biosynthesis protein LarC [Minicystis sp.]|nr:nickel pincer cofactor biosynthesis protein LarC [Minicystis sp.]
MPEHGHGHPHGHEHPHEHGHEHEHEHEHEHGHEHEHEHGTVVRAPLERGAGRGKILFFDAFSGIAGDMTIAALLDLGVPLEVVERAVGALPVSGYHLHRGHVHRSGIVAATFDVHVEAKQPERTYGSIDRMLEHAPLDDEVRALARRIFRRLGEAEADVHKTALEDVHFHEVGAVDAIVDVVGASAALVFLGADVVASPLPLGHGFVRARHGVLPLPAPAAVSCLRGVPTYAAGVEAELVTPTGAAIVASAAAHFARWPAFEPERVGWGGGQRELEDRPNLLRAVLGAPWAPDRAHEGTGTHVVLDANVDDMTGEMAAHAIERLLAAGALDAWASPVTMKKGRPALVISALTTAARADALAAELLRETTSLGVRKSLVTRTERPRRTIEVATPYGTLPVKVSDGPFGPPQMKPEFDACAAAADKHGVPVREVLAAALAAARAVDSLGSGG